MVVFMFKSDCERRGLRNLYVHNSARYLRICKDFELLGLYNNREGSIQADERLRQRVKEAGKLLEEFSFRYDEFRSQFKEREIRGIDSQDLRFDSQSI